MRPTAEIVAEQVTAVVRDALIDDPRLVVGLPTGRTPLLLYARLRSAGLDWSRARTFNLDEFVGLAPTDPRSYRSYMDRHLFSGVNLDPGAVGFLRGDADDLAAECRRYDLDMAKAGGLDLLICGLGTNGHIGFNEPAPALIAHTHIAELHAATRAANADRFGGDAGAVPSRALTMGMAAVMRARRVVVMATGATKADAVQAMVRGPLTTAVPASWLQVHPAVELVVDGEAAVGLDRAMVESGPPG